MQKSNDVHGTYPNTSLLDVNYTVDGNTLVMGSGTRGVTTATNNNQSNYQNIFIQSINTQHQLQANLKKSFDKFAL